MDIPYGYCKCGCGKKTSISKYNNKRLGYKAGEPIPCLRGHRIRPRNEIRVPLVDRFWKFVDKKGPDECWNWTGAKKEKGYGVIGVGQRICRASRISYEMAYGVNPGNKFVLHHCDNPSCVNPKHLFLGTNQDNMNDMCDKGLNAKILNNEKAREIKSLLAEGKLLQTEIATIYGVDHSTINKIAKGVNWKRA